MPLTTLNVAVDDYCNNRCQMCNIWRDEVKDGFSLEAAERFLKQNCDQLQGVKGLSFTGGEPFMLRDILELAELFIARLPSLKSFFDFNERDLRKEGGWVRERAVIIHSHSRNLCFP